MEYITYTRMDLTFPGKIGENEREYFYFAELDLLLLRQSKNKYRPIRESEVNMEILEEAREISSTLRTPEKTGVIFSNFSLEEMVGKEREQILRKLKKLLTN